MACPLLSPTALNGLANSHQILRFNDLCFHIICALTSVSPLPPHLPLCGQCGSALSNEPLCHRADLLKSTYFSSFQSMSSHTSILAFVPSRLPYLMSFLFAFTGNQGSRTSTAFCFRVEGEAVERGFRLYPVATSILGLPSQQLESLEVLSPLI